MSVFWQEKERQKKNFPTIFKLDGSAVDYTLDTFTFPEFQKYNLCILCLCQGKMNNQRRFRPLFARKIWWQISRRAFDAHSSFKHISWISCISGCWCMLIMFVQVCCCVDFVELMYGWILWWTRCGLVPACQSLLPRCQNRQHPRVIKGSQLVVRNLMSSCYMLLLFTLHSLDYIHRENESIRYCSEFCFVKISGRLQWLCPRGYQCARAFQLRQMLWFDPFVLFFKMVQTELYLLWSWPVRPIYCSDLDSVPVLDATLLAVTTCSSQALSEFSPSPTDYHRAGNTAVARTEVYGSALGTLLGSGMNYSMWITGVCLLSHLNTLTFISSQPGSCHKSV